MASDKPFPSQVAPKFNVRFPEGMREKIAELADKNHRSMNAEIVARMQEVLDREGVDQGIAETPPSYGADDARLLKIVSHLTAEQKKALTILLSG